MRRACEVGVHEADLAGRHGGCFAQVGVGGVEDVEVGFFVSFFLDFVSWVWFVGKGKEGGTFDRVCLCQLRAVVEEGLGEGRPVVVLRGEAEVDVGGGEVVGVELLVGKGRRVGGCVRGSKGGRNGGREGGTDVPC